MSKKSIAWLNTITALVMIVASFGSGNWQAAYFAFAAAYYAWVPVLEE